MSKSGPKTTVGVRLEQEWIAKLDQVASAQEGSRSDVARLALQAGLESLGASKPSTGIDEIRETLAELLSSQSEVQPAIDHSDRFDELTGRIGNVESTVKEIHGILKSLSFQVNKPRAIQEEKPVSKPKRAEPKPGKATKRRKPKEPEREERRAGPAERREKLRVIEDRGNRDYDDWRYMVSLRGARYVADIMNVSKSKLLDAIEAGDNATIPSFARLKFENSVEIQEALKHADSIGIRPQST